ncbi:MAG: acetylxylan esterase [Pirellulaceae bacterium]|nr:acetylxylan esterase [Pirellulaceae bacterium]
MKILANCLVALSVTFLLVATIQAQGEAPAPRDTSRGDEMIAEYFRAETEQLRRGSMTSIQSLEDWQSQRDVYRSQLLEMLGLEPLPEKTPLQAKVTGRVTHDEFFVENIHFQSRPGLYVTGNLYVPKQVDGKLPAILYVCGHGRVKKDGISYGNKVHYQHHGQWFARNGYVCLTIDTLQLGEIEGIHHGTYNHDMWWWLNRGYTPAGVEAWNCVRALDYLETRPEVDSSRFGVTGRSGGGAYSWWIAAIDERIKAAVPVAGITDLQNHVVDGCVEGHCDCMYMVNTHRWDYGQVAALVAPRPLLISNTDTDRIFPLDGVMRTFESVRRIYALHDAADKVALNITAGGHKDTQELRVHAFRWFNQHLKNDDSLIEKTATKFFEPPELRVLDASPEDEKNTEIHESFVAHAPAPTVPLDALAWDAACETQRKHLVQRSFAGWPVKDADLAVQKKFSVVRDGIQLTAFDFVSQSPITLRVYVAQRAGLERADLIVLNVLDDQAWDEFLATARRAFEKELAGEQLPTADQKGFDQWKQMFQSSPWAMAYVAPRGIGPTAWDQSTRKQTQHRRRFYLLGQSLDGMRIYDTRRAIQALRTQAEFVETPFWLQSQRTMAGVALYASLFEPEIRRLDLYDLPPSHRDGPYLLNVSRFVDLRETVAMVAQRSQVVLYDEDPKPWKLVSDIVNKLGWDKKQFQIRQPPDAGQ